MTDYHVHIGQFNKEYYDAHKVFDTIVSAGVGIDYVRYSSTSSCRYDVELFRIEEEIMYAQQYSDYRLTLIPYLWFVPKYAEQGIDVRSAMSSFDYCGIKIHSYAQHWDLENTAHRKCLDNIFGWADDMKKDVLIHCGVDKCCLPSRFEQFFGAYPNARIILAHSRPLDDTISMLQKYSNVYCDISYTPQDDVIRLTQTEYKHRILFGTDFPITHYWAHHLHNETISLQEQYKRDCQILLKAGLYSDCSREEI